MQRNVESHFSQLPQANIQRSIFDRSCSYKTSFNAGELIPFFVDEVLPGDTFDISTSKVVRTQTLLTPLMDNLYLDTFYFFVPARLTWLHWKQFCGENTSGPWAPSVEYTIPSIASPPGGFQTGTIADYMGLPVGVTWKGTDPLAPSALPFRAYALICDHFFRDENLQSPLLIPNGDSYHNSTRGGVSGAISAVMVRITIRNQQRRLQMVILTITALIAPLTPPLVLLPMVVSRLLSIVTMTILVAAFRVPRKVIRLAFPSMSLLVLLVVLSLLLLFPLMFLSLCPHLLIVFLCGVRMLILLPLLLILKLLLLRLFFPSISNRKLMVVTTRMCRSMQIMKLVYLLLSPILLLLSLTLLVLLPLLLSSLSTSSVWPILCSAISSVLPVVAAVILSSCYLCSALSLRMPVSKIPNILAVIAFLCL
ncbi:putative VP1 [Microviridae sp.]|nr:putative VP1 [Microviridae sp.]